MNDIRNGVIIKTAIGVLACVAFIWAVHPVFSVDWGFVPTGATEAEIIRFRYPIHIVDPGLLPNPHRWRVAESLARLGVLGIIVICTQIYRKLKRT